MRVVLESIEAGMANLIPDNNTEMLVVEACLLPEESKVGDVLETRFEERGNGNIEYSFRILSEETAKRAERIKRKRERLLKEKQ